MASLAHSAIRRQELSEAPSVATSGHEQEQDVRKQLDNLSTWAHTQFTDVVQVVEDITQASTYAKERASEIPDVPGLVREVHSLGRVLAEFLIRLQVVEHAMDDELRGRGKPGLHSLDPQWPRSPVQREVDQLRAEVTRLRTEVTTLRGGASVVDHG